METFGNPAGGVAAQDDRTPITAAEASKITANAVIARSLPQIYAGIRQKAKSGLRSFPYKFEPGVVDSDVDAIAASLRAQGFDVKATHAWADNRDHGDAQLEISWPDAARDA